MGASAIWCCTSSKLPGEGSVTPESWARTAVLFIHCKASPLPRSSPSPVGVHPAGARSSSLAFPFGALFAPNAAT